MTSPTGYTAEQALARDLPNVAFNGGASVCWAHVHGVVLDGTPDQVRAEGIHLSDRSVWSVDIDDLTRAITKLIEHPEDCGAPGNISDRRALPYVATTLAAARANGTSRVAELAGADADHCLLESHELIADFVMQLAVTGEVIR